mmetsp:Transcript_6657/g.22433  ORF Transcript_6657/g.22433 Transcript_6657/m.22433 type:complete len:282 (+) Transcript_6657:128-973(+)
MRSVVTWAPSTKTVPCWLFHRMCMASSGSMKPCAFSRKWSSSPFCVRCSRTMYCSCDDRGSMHTPPAAFMAAEEPVAVHSQMPLDHTLNAKSSSTAPSASVCRSTSRNLDTAAGEGWAMRMSLRAGGSFVSVYVLRTTHRSRVRREMSVLSARRMSGRSASQLSARSAQSAPVLRRSSLFLVTWRSSGRVGSELMPSTGTVSSTKWDVLSTVPSPPTATTASHPARCWRCSSSRVIAVYSTPMRVSAVRTAWTHCWCRSWRFLRRSQRSATGALPWFLSCM